MTIETATGPNTVFDSDIDTNGSVVLFDGVCNLCNSFVQFVIPRDPDGELRFASLQSAPAQELLRRHDVGIEDFDSIVLVEGEQVYTKSDAVLRIADVLGWPYSLARGGRLLPKPLRDWLYDVVADNRYDWFGRRDRCMTPDEDVRDRFLE